MIDVKTTSFFALGPHHKLEDKIEEIKRDNEAVNPGKNVIVEIINKTTEGCGPNTTMYYFTVEVKDKEIENKNR